MLHGTAIGERVGAQRGVVIEEAEHENEAALFVNHRESAVANQRIRLEVARLDLVGAAEAENGIGTRGGLLVVRGLHARFDAVAVRVEGNEGGVAFFDRAEVAVGDRDHVLPRTPLRRRNCFREDRIRRDEIFRARNAARFFARNDGLDFRDAVQFDLQPQAENHWRAIFLQHAHEHGLAGLRIVGIDLVSRQGTAAVPQKPSPILRSLAIFGVLHVARERQRGRIVRDHRGDDLVEKAVEADAIAIVIEIRIVIRGRR